MFEQITIGGVTLGGIYLAVLSAIGHAVLKVQLSKNVETLRDDLKRKSQEEGIRYKAELERARDEFKNGLEKEGAMYRAGLDRARDEFKNKLENAGQAQMIEYKHGLDLQRTKLEIKFGGIFEKQANAILELYRLVVEFHSIIDRVIHNNAEDSASAHSEFIGKLREMVKYYNLNEILMPASISSVFYEFYRESFTSVNGYQNAERRFSLGNLSDDQIKKLFEKQDRSYAALKEIETLKTELKACLRKTIGTTEREDS